MIRMKMKYIQPGILATLAVGVVVSAVAWAATNTYSTQEAEAGTRTSAASVVADASASGSSAIRFGEVTTSTCPIPDRVTVTNANKAEYPAYPSGTKLYVPDGPDPWGGCFPGPLSTGVPSGTQLTNYTGSCTITTANTVIDKKTINCTRLDIRAQGIVITNSRINGRVLVDDTRCDTASFTITDSTIYNGGGEERPLMYCSYTATRVDASGSGSMAVCMNGCTIRDSYLHDPDEDPTGTAHNSTVRLGARATLEHNTLHCNVREYPANDGSGETSGCSANQTAYSHDGWPPYETVSRRNFYAATTGGYCGYGGSTGGSGANQVRDVKFIENIFQRGNKDGNWGTGSYMCGFYGPMTSMDLSRPGNEFTGNIWDNGKPVILQFENGWADSWGEPCGSQPQCTW